MSGSALRTRRLGRRLDIELAADATRNALSADLVDEVTAVLEDAAVRGVRSVVIRSATRAFSSGFDLTSIAEETDASLAHRFLRIARLLEMLTEADFTSIALMDGPAVGAGADVALACDHRVGTPNSSFRFPGAGFGLVLGSDRLRTWVGPAEAMELISRGSVLSADAAATRGVIKLFTDVEKAEHFVEELAVAADRLPDKTLAPLRRTIGNLDIDRSLAGTARSVLRPGLKDRVESYARLGGLSPTASTKGRRMTDLAQDPALTGFIDEVGELIDRGLDEKQLTVAVAERLREVLADGLNLPPEVTAAREDRYVMYPLHVDPEGRFSIASAVWNVGQSTPVHGHETWGVVGIHSGYEDEVSYEKPREPDVPLTSEGEHRWSPGEVTVCCTTDDDVHLVSCGGDTPCVGIHVYGADIGRLERRSYDPTTGAVSWFVSTWADPAVGPVTATSNTHED